MASVWTPTGGLGHVQGGQYGGYLFPMGPFFAACRALGLSPWVIDRLWLGALLALAAWGTVRLLDALLQGQYGERRGIAHVVAGGIILANPYVVVFANRTSVTLLGYAALPWLMLAVHRGVRTPGRWWWPAAFALLVTSTGGGVNAAVTAWILLGPLLLLVYEPLVVGVPWADVRRFIARAAAATVAASLWWLAPIVVQGMYGIDFLKFTEQPGTIWGTTALPESLRLMGYWLSYVDVGFVGRVRLFFDDAHTMLFAPGVVVASLLAPALALAGFQWTRRWRYGPFFLALALFGLIVMVAGFPEGTPLRRALTFTYYHLQPIQFLRTPYKAAPLLVLAVAVLAGTAAAELWRRMRWVVPGSSLGMARAGLLVACAALIGASAWPLLRGRGIDRQVVWKRIPAAWTHTARGLDRTLPRNTRAVVLPGALFAFYRWGGTYDPILPALTRRPVAVRQIVPYADLHATDLLWTVDALVQQQRAYPGVLRPLLSLLGAGAVISGRDYDVARSGALDPVDAANVLADQGLAARERSYGPRRRFDPPAGELDRPLELSQVTRYDLRPDRPVVRVEPAGPETIVDGSADGLAGLAAFGALPTTRPLLYAGDRTAADVRRAAAQGADVVITDSNRRRVFAAARLAQNVGATLAAGDPISHDAAVLNPFSARGPNAQTVAVYHGARYLRAPQSPGFSLFPEHRPFTAFDGSPFTAWLADPRLEPSRRWIEIGFGHRRNVDYLSVFPYEDQRAIVQTLEIGGRRFKVHPGWNRLHVRLRRVSSLRIRIARARYPKKPGGGGGLAEIRIPGVSIREVIRPPVLAEHALRGVDLSRSGLSYLFARTTGDTPFRRAAITGPAGAQEVRDRADGEIALARVLDPPVARTWTMDAWVSVSPTTPDSQLDRLAGSSSAIGVDSSGRFENQPRYRASGAFDGGPRSWIGDFVKGRPAWLSWRTPTAVTLSGLRLRPTPVHVRFPTAVRLSWPGGASPPLRVAPAGDVALPRAVRAKSFRLEVVDAAFPAGTTPAQRKRRAVGIGEVEAPGLPRLRVPTTGPLHAGCSLVRVNVGRAAAALRVTGSVGELDAGRPLRAAACGPPIRLPAGAQELHAPAGAFLVGLLRLRSPPPAGAVAAWGGGRLVDAGHAGRGRYDGIHLRTARAGWLVLGESFNRGWRAWCDGRALGAPTVIDGYANGWALRRSCRGARFAFAPARVVTWADWASVLACLALVLVLLLRRGAAAARAPGDGVPLDVADRARAWPLRRAGLAGLAAGLVLGFMFAARAGPPIAIAITLILWRGVGVRTLVGLAGGLLVLVVPILYLALVPHDALGTHFQFPVAHIEAHWVTLGAVVFLAAALWRTLAAARAVRSSPPR